MARLRHLGFTRVDDFWRKDNATETSGPCTNHMPWALPSTGSVMLRRPGYRRWL